MGGRPGKPIWSVLRADAGTRVVYGLEAVDNPGLEGYHLDPAGPLMLTWKPGLLDGVNVITGRTTDSGGREMNFIAVPFYALGNRQTGAAYRVWIRAAMGSFRYL